MQTAPLPPDEAKRIAALMQCGVLDTEAEQDFDDLTRLAADLLNVPIALVSLIDRDRQWFKSKVGLDACESGRDVAFCSHAILGEDLFVVPDATRDERFHDNPFVTDPPHIRFYAGAPLRSADGFNYGTLCVIDNRPRELRDEHAEVLRGLARQATAQLELRRNNRRLESEMAVRREAERQLEQARDAAEAASRAKSAFLANMSHEIRTPLGAITGFADQLTSLPDAPEPERRDWIDTIRRSAEHLLSLVNDVLDVSKIEAEQMTFESIPVDPLALAREAVELLRPKAADKGLDIALEPRGEPPAAVRGDPTRLKQVLLNLLSNAVKFTQTGRVALAVEHHGEGDHARLTFAVHDTGPGVEPDVLTRLFNAFCQADQTVTRRHGGTGLGLHISREICRRLGGDLTVRSVPGEGSTFVAEVAGVVTEAVDTASPPSDPTPACHGERHRCRVLIADDSPTNRKLLSLILRRAGFEVSIAEDGQQALDACKRKAADGGHHLVLMDVQMPRLDGLEATRRLRAMSYRRPILALTADATLATRDAALAAGCDDCLTKPVRAETLVDTLTTHLNHARHDSPASDRAA